MHLSSFVTGCMFLNCRQDMQDIHRVRKKEATSILGITLT